MMLGAGGEFEALKHDSPLAKFNEQPRYKDSTKAPLTYAAGNRFNLSFSPKHSATEATLTSFSFMKIRDFSLVTLTKTEAGNNPKTTQVKVVLGTFEGDSKYKTYLDQGFVLTDIHPYAQAQEVTITKKTYPSPHK